MVRQKLSFLRASLFFLGCVFNLAERIEFTFRS